MSEPNDLRARVGRLVQRVYPNLDENAYFRARRRDMADRADTGAYDDLLLRRPEVSATPRTVDRPAHVVVVPQEGRDFDSWRPGTRNFYYEAAQNLAENIGADHVSVFHVERGTPFDRWHVQLADYLLDTGATHLLTHIESDPGTEGRLWTWDSLWSVLSTRWDGVLLGVMFDSAYRFINAKSRFLARMSPSFMVVDICMPMDGSMRKGRFEVGPVNMPVSRQSLALVDERLAGVGPQHDLSFIGVLYPYRVELIEALRAQGFSVAVNPHRADVTVDADQSRANQPGWLDYMAGLRSSRATINFSRSSAGPFEQLKTRVIEAGLAGTLLLTDDRDRTRLFWTPEVEYGYFADLEDLPRVAERFLSDPAKLESARAAFERRARELAHSNFWDGIEDGLQRRALPRIARLPS